MTTPISRRQWLTRTAAVGLGAFLYPWEQSLQATNSYEPTLPFESNLTRLGSNENPLGPSPKVKQAMIEALENGCRYPWGTHAPLIEALANIHGVSTDCIVLCAGSNEGLRATASIYGGPQQEIIAADPTYLALLSYAEQLGTYIHKVPLTADFQHDLDAMAARISRRTGMVFICNPNNPTGTLLDSSQLSQFIAKVSQDTVVFSDEAYYDYISDVDYPSMVKYVKEGKNVIVSKTFSKVYGLAGIRAGYIIARPDIAKRIRSAVMASMNIVATAAARAALEDKPFYELSLQNNKKQLAKMYQLFHAMQLQYIPSYANFVMVNLQKDISWFLDAMRKEGVIVGRPFPPYSQWCRISTGNDSDYTAFERAFRKVMIG